MRTMEKNIFNTKSAHLVDAVDRVIEKGAYVGGDVLLEVAEVELIYIGLRLVIVSAPDRYENKNGERARQLEEIRKLQERMREVEANIEELTRSPSPERAEKGIAKLVLTLIVLIKELMEREAIRKIDRGSLTKEQKKRIGSTFALLDKKVEELKRVFGIEEELDLDLGPLGRLLE